MDDIEINKAALNRAMDELKALRREENYQGMVGAAIKVGLLANIIALEQRADETGTVPNPS